MYYNLYYNNEVINNTPVGNEIIEKMQSKDYIFKVRTDALGVEHRQKIPVKDIKCVETYVF